MSETTTVQFSNRDGKRISESPPNLLGNVCCRGKETDAVISPNFGIRGNPTLVARSTLFRILNGFRWNDNNTRNMQMPLKIVFKAFLGVLFSFVV